MLLFTAKKGKLPAGVENAEGLLEGIKFAIHPRNYRPRRTGRTFSNSPWPGAFRVGSIIEWPEDQESESESEGEKPEEVSL